MKPLVLVAVLSVLATTQVQAEVIRASDFPVGTDVTHLGLFSWSHTRQNTVVADYGMGKEFVWADLPRPMDAGYHAPSAWAPTYGCAPPDPYPVLILRLGAVDELIIPGATIVACNDGGEREPLAIAESRYAGAPADFFFAFSSVPLHVKKIYYSRVAEPSIAWLLSGLALAFAFTGVSVRKATQ